MGGNTSRKNGMLNSIGTTATNMTNTVVGATNTALNTVKNTSGGTTTVVKEPNSKFKQTIVKDKYGKTVGIYTTEKNGKMTSVDKQGREKILKEADGEKHKKGLSGVKFSGTSSHVTLTNGLLINFYFVNKTIIY
jgi:hypothetical protein